MQAIHFILYVSDQNASCTFYERTLGIKPRLHVPGMTEFDLANGTVLGLMPAAGIRRLLGDALPDPEIGRRIPRAELYLMVDDPADSHQKAIAAGAHELSPLSPRNWGHTAAYSMDADGHILAFAKETAPEASS